MSPAYKAALFSLAYYIITYSIRSVKGDGKINGNVCPWAPSCKCAHLQYVERGYPCVYNSMYIDGHDVATCTGQKEFPLISNTNDVNDFTDINGNFSHVPANALAYKQYISRHSACVFISTKSPRLTLDRLAFNKVEGIFAVEDVEAVTVMPEAVKAALVPDEEQGPGRYGRYGVESTGLHFYDVKTIDLPENFVNTVIPNNSATVKELSFRLHVENSELTNLDRNRFGFANANVDEIEFPWLSAKYLKEVLDIFYSKTSKSRHVTDMTLVTWSAKNRLRFRLDLKNAILSNGNRSIDLGLSIDKVKVLSFQSFDDEGDQEQYLQNLTIFKQSLKTLKCSKCNLKRIPNDISFMTNLVELNLAENKISSISTDTFSKTTNLSILDLSSNQIRSIDPTAFDNLINLKSIDLSYNSLGRKQFRVLSEKLGKLPNLKEFLCNECETKTRVRND